MKTKGKAARKRKDPADAMREYITSSLREAVQRGLVGSSQRSTQQTLDVLRTEMHRFLDGLVHDRRPLAPQSFEFEELSGGEYRVIIPMDADMVARVARRLYADGMKHAEVTAWLERHVPRFREVLVEYSNYEGRPILWGLPALGAIVRLTWRPA